MALCHMTGLVCDCTVPQLCCPSSKKRYSAEAKAHTAAPDIEPSVVLEPDGFFRAIDHNNYDVDCDHTGFYSNSPTGYGRTPLDAIVSLLDNTERRSY